MLLRSSAMSCSDEFPGLAGSCTKTPLLAVRCSLFAPAVAPGRDGGSGSLCFTPPRFDLLSLLCSHPPQFHPVLGWRDPARVPAAGGQIRLRCPIGASSGTLEPAGRGHLSHHHHTMRVSKHRFPPQSTTAGQGERSGEAPGPGEATAAPQSSGGTEQDEGHGGVGPGGSGWHRALLPALRQPRR